MKRVLIFSLNYYPRFVGGAEVAIKEITDRISDIEFHMVTLRFDSNLPKVEKVGNVLVHRIGPTRKNPSIANLRKFPLHLNKYLYQYLAGRKAAALHRKYSYDAIWAMMAHSSGIPAANFKSSHKDVPYLLTLQEGDPPEYIERMMKPVWPFFKRAFTTADHIQTISTFLLKWARSMGFSGKASVIPNAVNIEHFSQVFSQKMVEEMKQRLGKKEGDMYMVTTSRLVHKNAVDDVIRSLSLLPHSVSFLIYGIGPDEEKLRSLAAEIGVSDRARFMGYIDHTEMPLMFSACDIFIRPSRSEGMGNSFVEAFAAGLPVIATQEGGIADFFFDERRNPEKETTGWAVDADSPEQIAEAVKDILERPDKVTKVIRNAKELALSKYDWNLIAGDMQTLFKELLGTR
ncbi:MAG TPA: glycosyltransferase [Candidatus Paceibacterota bacterium]